MNIALVYTSPNVDKEDREHIVLCAVNFVNGSPVKYGETSEEDIPYSIFSMRDEESRPVQLFLVGDGFREVSNQVVLISEREDEPDSVVWGRALLCVLHKVVKELTDKEIDVENMLAYDLLDGRDKELLGLSLEFDSNDVLKDLCLALNGLIAGDTSKETAH